jgi:hypothetical protein
VDRCPGPDYAAVFDQDIIVDHCEKIHSGSSSMGAKNTLHWVGHSGGLGVGVSTPSGLLSSSRVCDAQGLSCWVSLGTCDVVATAAAVVVVEGASVVEEV